MRINKTFKTLFLLIAVTSLSSCGNKEEDNSHKLTDLCLTIKDTNYDFTSGVSFKDNNGNFQKYTVESNVVFGTAGKYQVKYILTDSIYTRDIYIYGTPSLELINSDIKYTDAVEYNFSSNVKALDTFGGEAFLVCLSSFEKSNIGQLKTGNQEMLFKATDKFGNFLEKKLTLNVLEPTEKMEEHSYVVDYSSPYLTLELGSEKIESIYFKDRKLASEYYVINNEHLMITPNFIKEIGSGNSCVLYINYTNRVSKITINVTDDASPAYELINDFTESKYYLNEEIKIPQIRLKTGSIQRIESKYFIELDSEKIEIFSGSFIPVFGGNYKYTAEIYRNSSLIETVTRDFVVGHFNREPIDLGDCLAVHASYDLTLRTDLTDPHVEFSFENNNGVLEIVGNSLNVLKEGTATLIANINNNEIVKRYDITTYDFKHYCGSVRDFSLTSNVWQSYNGSTITSKKVDDIRTSEKKYAFDAISANGGVTFPGNIVEAAKSVDYKYLQFNICLSDVNASFTLSLCKNGVVSSEPIINDTNNGRWSTLSVPLSKIEKGYDLLFESSSEILNIAKVEFVGADISDYVETFIKFGSTAGKSIDLINNDLIGKLYLSTCNTNNQFEYTNTGMDKTSSTDNGDYITFKRTDGFYSESYGTTENNIYLNSEWIMAAKDYGYATFGLFINNNPGYMFMKKSIDGKLSNFKNNGKEWHAQASNKWQFISLDLTTFEYGDTLIISCSGESIQISGATFRTASFGEPNLKI